MALDNLQDIKSQIVAEVKAALASDVVAKAKQVARDEATKVVETYQHVREQLGKDTATDRALDGAMVSIAKRWSIFNWVARKFEKWAAWQEVLLLLVLLGAIIGGVVWIKNKFQDNSYQTQNQVVEKAKTDKVAEGASADTNAAQLKAEYDRAVGVAEAQQKQISDLQSQLYAQQSRTAQARANYQQSVAKPVPASEYTGDTVKDAQLLKVQIDAALEAAKRRGSGQ